MTQDNGWDASPSWQELKAERDALSAENAALDQERSRARLEAMKLAAHVDLLHAAILRPFIQCCTDEDAIREARHIAVNQSPITSLARLKAEWQADILDEVGSGMVDIIDRSQARVVAKALRRQATEDS